jgi:hypothetical protein
LALLLRPFFSQALAAAVAGGSIYAILVDPAAVAALFLVLGAGYGLALLVALTVARGAGIQRLLRALEA